MSTCPKCLKVFDTTKGVTLHQAQPQSACNINDSWHTEVVSVTSTSQAEPMVTSYSCSASHPPPPDFLPMLEINPDYIRPDTDPNSGDHRSPSPAQPSFAKSLLLPASDNMGRVAVHSTGAGLVYNTGATFINHFDADPYSAYWQINVFYPFSDLDEWKMANYLLTSKLSMSALDKFLSLKVTKKMSLSFSTAKELHAWAGLLPLGP
ncbi:hypothetical protein J3A83DRAFT_4370671 [Scleroderma citrinum]